MGQKEANKTYTTINIMLKPKRLEIGKLVVVAGNIMQFLIFCSSVFVFECWEFAMTLVHIRKLVLQRRATYC